MIVPRYWAEGRARQERRGKAGQITVRRFGWSDLSQADAQTLADTRAHQALERLAAGEKLPRRDPKLPYNGALGVPIREEIVAQHGDAIITRNAYGARCLNTPNVLFVDIDFANSASLRFKFAFTVVLAVAVVLIALVMGAKPAWLLSVIAAGLFGGKLADLWHRAAIRLRGGPADAARARIRKFLGAHDGWNVRLYRTPAGLRVLVTHQTFATDDPVVAACFDALGADPLYARMCANQKCFRARVSAKPWRMGLGEHLKPRPGVWPVSPERIAQRNAWIETYEAQARGFAACAFMESLGSDRLHPEAARVAALHDELCGAMRSLPMA